MSKKQSSPSSQVQKEESTKLPEKKFTIQEAKNYVLECAKASFDPKTELEKFSEEYMPKIVSGNPGKEIMEDLNKSLSKIAYALSIETGYALLDGIEERYRGLALEIKQALIVEFECKTIAEKTLIDLAVSSYIRNITYTKRMENNQKYIGQQYDSYRNYLSREVDRAHRQYISALESLRLIKQPALKVNVKTQNAFISEKQQFNNNVKNNEAK